MTKFWLGKKRYPETIEKMRLGNLGHRRSPKTEFKKGGTPWNKGKKYGKYVRMKGYAETHMWLRYHYGKADHCDNKNCKNKYKIFQWAKLKDKKYERKRENFIQLCQSCHQLYDRGKDINNILRL